MVGRDSRKELILQAPNTKAKSPSSLGVSLLCSVMGPLECASHMRRFSYAVYMLTQKKKKKSYAVYTPSTSIAACEVLNLGEVYHVM